MNTLHNKERWYKELDSHIKCFYRFAGQRKTILINLEKPHLYLVVTRVNFISTQQWIEYVNSIIKTLPKNKVDLQRFCWLTEQRQYKKQFLSKLKNEY